MLALAREADVMVDNYRPGVLRRHGLGYDDVKAVNPRIVYCAISGYGYSDPARTPHGAYDHVIQALTGMTMLAGTEGDPPVKTGFPVIDAATGIIGALAIVIALRERDRTGAGCFLDVSMWASALQLMYSVRLRDAHFRPGNPARRQQGLFGQPGGRHLRLPRRLARDRRQHAGARRAPDGGSGRRAAGGRAAAGTRSRGRARLRPRARSAARSANCSRRAWPSTRRPIWSSA